jgi:hypothetical protein
VRKVTTALISLGLVGCLHRSAEDRILAAFSGSNWDGLFSAEATPQFVAFRDDASARVFRNVSRSGAYRIAPTNQPLFCPGVPEKGNHGYLLGARVDTVMGDSAFATVTLMCTRFVSKCASGQFCASWGSTIQYETNYLLARSNGNWKVVRAVSGGVAIPM